MSGNVLVKVQSCQKEKCLLCPHIKSGNKFQFNCGFVFEVKEEKLNCNSTDVIYVLKCSTCGAEYIGETENARRRMNTHSSHIRTGQRLCRATDHLIECGTHLSDVRDRFSIFFLEIERDKYIRKAKESYYIRLFLPKMNK
jgi:predicted GIY-YIG superfamily endonuclease